MKQKHFLFIAVSVFTAAVFAQQPQPSKSIPAPLPPDVFSFLHDSCTSLDMVYLTGRAGSLSLDGNNVKFFTNFMNPRPQTIKESSKQDATIMWEKNGKEYLSGAVFFTSDSSGYIKCSRNNQTYVNALTKQGAGFLQTHGR